MPAHGAADAVGNWCWGPPSAEPYHRGMASDRQEDIALLALLRLQPQDMTWAKIANEVQLEGSAVSVLDGVREADHALVPDPEIEMAITRADAELAEWEAAGLDFISILSGRYPAQTGGCLRRSTLPVRRRNRDPGRSRDQRGRLPQDVTNW